MSPVFPENPQRVDLDAAAISALYALRGTIKKHGQLSIFQAPGKARLIVEHRNDGRLWAIDSEGTHRIEVSTATR